MGEPLYITDVYSLLNKNVKGLIDVKSVKIVPKSMDHIPEQHMILMIKPLRMEGC